MGLPIDQGQRLVLMADDHVAGMRSTSSRCRLGCLASIR